MEEPSGGGSHWISSSWVEHVDVRPLLERGEEPAGVLIPRLSNLPRHRVLVVDVPFDPVPLRNKATVEGLTPYHREPSPGHHRVAFCRNEDFRPEEADHERFRLELPAPRRGGLRYLMGEFGRPEHLLETVMADVERCPSTVGWVVDGDVKPTTDEIMRFSRERGVRVRSRPGIDGYEQRIEVRRAGGPKAA